MSGIFQYQQRRREASREQEEAQERRERERRLANQRRRRAYIILAIIFGIMGILGWRLAYWQVLARDEVLAQQPLTQIKAPEEPARGTIRDRNGYLLAVDSTKYSFAVSANLIAQPEALARDVSPLIDVPEEELVDTFRGEDTYSLIKSSLTYTAGQQLVDMDEPAFIVEPRLERSYPNGALAAHVLGFVNAEGDGYGLERTFADWLAGEAPVASTGPVAEEVKFGGRPFAPSRNGVDLVLTLDRNIQFMAEQELERAIEMYSAEGGTIIVMGPHTGDVLAMANWPSYDPNEFASTPSDRFVNPAIAEQYEPGSVFKAITIAAALDNGTISADTVYEDKGLIEVGGQLIRNWDGGSKGLVTITEILGYSLNTGTAWVNTQLGVEAFVEYVHAFGFGQPTNLGIRGEASGAVKEPGDGSWSPSDLGTNAFGQGIAVTPIQMVTAFTALLNEGQMMEPRLVRAVVDSGKVTTLEPTPSGRPIQPSTARLMQSMLADAVEVGMKSAQIDGYRVGGKTGTAQVPIPGGYHPKDTIASFVGYVPANDPTVLILVKLDKPKGEYQWGSNSAAPTFQRLAQRILTYQNVPIDRLRVANDAQPPSEVQQ